MITTPQSIIEEALDSLTQEQKDLILEDFLRCVYDGRILDSVDGWPADPNWPPHPPAWVSLIPLEDWGFHYELAYMGPSTLQRRQS